MRIDDYTFWWETRNARVTTIWIKKDPDMQISKFLPEGESCISSLVQDQNNQLNRCEKLKKLAFAGI